MGRGSQSGVYGERVMTEEQLQDLRKQIAVYATISDQLVLLHKSLSSGTWEKEGGGDIGSKALSSRLTVRQRWTPTAGQLEKLEHIYSDSNGPPNRQRIREITAELSQLGSVTETNVYNWFQNRKARAKRKLQEEEMTAPATATAAPAASNKAQQKEAKEDEEEATTGHSAVLESYDHLLFPTPDLGIEHLLGEIDATVEPRQIQP